MKQKGIIVFLLSVLLIIGFFSYPIASIGESDDQNDELSQINLMEFPVKSKDSLKEMNPDPQPTVSTDDLPDQFSWTDYGGNWLTTVKNHGDCGSCWAFCALSVFEAAINIASGSPDLDIDLSEQYILSCLPASGSCYGGWMSDAIRYMKSTVPGPEGNGVNGCTVESCMPYQNVDTIPCSDKCDDWNYSTDPPQADNKLWQIESFGETEIDPSSPSDWDLLKSWIMTHGPLAVDMFVSQDYIDFWQTHHSPYDVYEGEEGHYTNWGQVLCGWVDDPDVKNGGYWILQNFWGTEWGYGGYNNVAYGCLMLGDRDVCWIAAEPWPEGGVPDPFEHGVAANFDTDPSFPHPGDEIEFIDQSEGDIIQYAWDFNGDSIIDSTGRNPTWTYPEEGEYEVTLEIVNEWGLNNSCTKIVETQHAWPPIAIINPEEYIDNDLEVIFDGRYSMDRDGGRIVSYEWDFDDGTTETGGVVTHVFPEPDRIYEVSLTVTDDDGASERVNSLAKIDQSVPPVTTISHGIGSDDGSNWYATTQRISFDATDWKEVIDTFYRIDEGEWIRYEAAEQQFIPVSSEGWHTIEAYSVDYYGNVETPVSESFGIDKQPPTVDLSMQDEPVDGWFDSPVTVALSGSDDRSGLEKIMVKIDNGGWNEYVESFILDEGKHSVWIVAVDNAGNIQEEIKTIQVDNSGPYADCSFEGEGKDQLFYRSVDIRFYGSDAGSGVDQLFYRIDGGEFILFETPVTVNTIGDHTVDFYAVDHLGNKGDTESKTFMVSPVNFQMKLLQPNDCLYLFGTELFGLNSPVIIGSMDVIVELESFTSQPPLFDYIEFILDGKSMEKIYSEPYKWRLEGQLFGQHTLRIQTETGIELSGVNDLLTESIDLVCIIP